MSYSAPLTSSEPAFTSPSPPPARSRLWIWFVWLAGFYAAWLLLVTDAGGWATVREHWGIAVAMAAGSYVAGSTPMGGGTIGFPILVLLFGEPAQLGRDFSFAVQSIGMTSAALFIFSRRQPVAWSLLRPAMLGSLVGTPLGVLYVAPHVPAVAIKLLFAAVWASFGVLHLYRTRDFAAAAGLVAAPPADDRRLGFGIGLMAGATVAAITGVGIDMVLYAALVLLRRADLKVAIPTSVIIMAFTSLVGIATKGLVTGVQPGVYESWLAAAPIVALGAPLGAFVVSVIGRVPTLYVVSVLCLGQLAWTLSNEWPHLGTSGLVLTMLGIAVSNGVFEGLYRYGRRAPTDVAVAAASRRLCQRP